ncbi:MAG: DUF308 domain-containing protein [Xanthobacteraceae bacterium]
MMVVLLIGGIGVLLAGLLTVGLGIQMDLSFGNTLILSGTVAACTGAIMLSLWAAVRELRKIASWLGLSIPAGTRAAPGAARDQAPEKGGFSFSRDLPSVEEVDHAELPAPSTAPWREEPAARDRGPSAPEPVEAAPAAKPRRNLLFSSSSRKERERIQGRMGDPSEPDLAPEPPAEPSEVPPASFDDTWPKPERLRGDAPAPRRRGRTPPALTEANAGAAAADRYPPTAPDQPPVTILKSGVVDGMAYSLYSDGSIEAQLPEGLMRFASIDELRAHLDQRS